MVINQQIIEKIVHLLQLWHDKERPEAATLEELGKEIREDMGIPITSSSALTHAQAEFISQAVETAVKIFDERNSNAN